MDKNRLWVIGSVLVMAVVIGLGWIVGIQPQLANSAASDAERVQVQATNAAHQATLAQLKKDFSNLEPLNRQLAALSQSVPSGTAIPAFVDEVNALSASSAVTVTGATFADALPYAPVAAPAAAAPASGSTSSSTATPTPTPTPTPSAGSTASPAPYAPVAGMPPVVNPKITPANFSSLAVTLTVQGGYQRILDFVHGLQTGERLFLVTGITTTAITSTTGTPVAPGDETATITGLIYVVSPTGTTAGATH